MDHFKTILVPVDFSDRSVAALRMASDIAGNDGRVEVVHVLGPIIANEPGVIWGSVDDASRFAHATDALTDLLGGLGLNTSRTHVVVTRGNAAHGVVKVESEVQPDLIIVPSTGRTGLAALGSVAERIVRLAKTPVLVLHPG
ncbi:MAG: universal stress protein [Proteobacteria bacterium]|nr:universal stress protein [Pseudomonadota bacterium]